MNPTETYLLDTLKSRFKDEKLCIVMIHDGDMLKTHSGKFAWSSIGAAKNALRNDAHALLTPEQRKNIDWKKLYNQIQFHDAFSGVFD